MSGSSTEMSRSAASFGEPAHQIARRRGAVERVRDPPPVGLRRLHRHPGQRQRRRQRLVEIDDHPAARAVPGVELIQRAVVHDPAVVDHDQAPAQPLDVGQVVRRQHDRRVAGAPSAARNARTACLLTRSSPIVGSSRNSTSGPCSSAAVSSPRIRWPSESCRTGMSRNGSRSSSRRQWASRAACSAAGTA